MNNLQAIAADYAAHGLTTIPALPGAKVAAIHWKTFQIDPPTERERNAMFSEPGMNLGVVCGSVSGNLAMIDAETPRAFDLEYERCHRAGLTHTWIDRSPSGGGHIWLRLPFAVASRGKVQDVEVIAQDKYALAPPSIAPSKVDGALHSYEFANRPPKIFAVESLDQLHWLNLERASLRSAFRAFPRRAQQLLKGEFLNHYGSRSEHEQAIVTILVNGAFSFEEILSAFRQHQAAGKFAQLERRDPSLAIEWLRVCYKEARDWTVRESAARRNALDLLAFANSTPWPGHAGSSTRAVFIAHAALCYRSGRRRYHASVRDLAQIAGCDKDTASAATSRLLNAGKVTFEQKASLSFARKFSLPDAHSLREKDEVSDTPYKPTCEGVSVLSSFLVPEAFRPRGLGRASYEVLQAFDAGPLTCALLAEKTGRHVQTVRKALKRLKTHGLVAKTGKLWRGRALEDIDIEQLTRAVGMRGAAAGQRDRHAADRIRYEQRQRLRAENQRQREQSEHGGKTGPRGAYREPRDETPTLADYRYHQKGKV